MGNREIDYKMLYDEALLTLSEKDEIISVQQFELQKLYKFISGFKSERHVSAVGEHQLGLFELGTTKQLPGGKCSQATGSGEKSVSIYRIAPYCGNDRRHVLLHGQLQEKPDQRVRVAKGRVRKNPGAQAQGSLSAAALQLGAVPTKTRPRLNHHAVCRMDTFKRLNFFKDFFSDNPKIYPSCFGWYFVPSLLYVLDNEIYLK
jgi:hypothetical protein